MTKKPSQSVRARRVAHRERQKRQRMLVAGIAVAALIIIAGLALWTRAANTADVDMVLPDSLDGPAAADGTAWGPAEAPVLIEEFSDFQCPFCGRHARDIMPQLLAKYGDTGLVRYEFNNYAFIGAESTRASEAALCAADQNRFWPYHDMLYLNQSGENRGAFRTENLLTFAEMLGLDTAAFTTCVDGRTHRAAVQDSLEAGKARGVTSTPIFFVNGQRFDGVQPITEWDRLITNALGAQ